MEKSHIFLLTGIMVMMLLAACGKVNEQTSDNIVRTEASTENTDASAEERTEELEDAANSFEWIPYLWNDIYDKAYGSSFHTDFDNYVCAVLNHETEFVCQEEKNTWIFLSFANYVCPIVAELVDDVTYRDGIASIVYSVDEKTADEMIHNFKQRIEELLNESIEPGDSDSQKAVLLFYNYVNKLSYDFDALYSTDNAEWSVYRGLMDYTGICQSFAGGYSYLCNQCGIQATVVYGPSDTRNEYHVWSLVKIGDNYYYMDPTYNTRENSGLSYFGMTTEERIKQEDYYPENYNIAFTNTLNGNDVQVTDTTFQSFWNSTEITNIIRENGNLNIEYIDTNGVNKTVIVK